MVATIQDTLKMTKLKEAEDCCIQMVTIIMANGKMTRLMDMANIIQSVEESMKDIGRMTSVTDKERSPGKMVPLFRAATSSTKNAETESFSTEMEIPL